MTGSLQSSSDAPRQPLGLSLGAVLAVCAGLYVFLYGPTLWQATFINDDWFHLERIASSRIPHLFYGDWIEGYRHAGGFYRPLPRVLIQLARRVFELHTLPYLLLSAAFHLANCALVWLLAFRLSRQRRIAWTAALVFAVYPTHPEALLQISTWADLLAVGGCLLALNGYLALRETNAPRPWAAALAGVLLGMLSKESWVSLPLVVILVELIWPKTPMALWLDSGTRRRVAVFIALAFGYVVVRHVALGGIGGYGINPTPASIQKTFDAVFQMVLFPFLPLDAWGELINSYTLLGAMILVWMLLEWPRLLLFGLGWMIVTALPLLTIAPSLQNGGRLVYLVTIGWALFLGGVYDGLIRAGGTPRARRTIGWIFGTLAGGALVATLAVRCNDWRWSFRENKRLLDEMVAVTLEQPPQTHYAILDWPRRFGMALSNRPDTAARALATLARINPEHVDRLLAPDDPSGTITFEVVEKPRANRRPAQKLRAGFATAVQTWHWTGDALDQWRPWQQARLVHSGADGPRLYVFEDNNAGLVGPDLAGPRGYYSILLRYEPVRRDWGFVMWRGQGEAFLPLRTATLQPLPRLRFQGQVAALGACENLLQVLLLPSSDGKPLTFHSILITGFDIQPLAR